MDAPFKLSTAITGHINDVRCVAISNDPVGIVTASRDKTAKFWQLSEDGRSFNLAGEMEGHGHYVNATAAVPPCRFFPEGIVLTGCLDGVIRAFSFEGGLPLFELKGHEKSVTCLAVSSEGTIISGGWDYTVKIWQNRKVVKSFDQHTLAVWDVTVVPNDQMYVSASADKMIHVYNASDWSIHRKLAGHTDVVRCVRAMSTAELLSCSNDGTLRRWSVSGDCIGVYPAHEPFTYCISFWPTGEFVTSGEDRVIKVWRDFEVVQNVNVPTLTNWSVACLLNGDFAVGSSDGTVRVFSRVKQRQAPEDELKAYEQKLSEVKIHAPELQGLDVESMPGKEALLFPGSRDGQTRLIKDAKGNVSVYSWASAENEWLLVGSVVGTKDKAKKQHNGREYDLLFDVDLGDNHPKLKLGYNKGEDPWVAAQRFIHEQQLSQEFIDQVAQFIISQTKDVAHLYPQASAADPFTGGSRYIPGSGTPGLGSAMAVGGAADPFTGASGYRPGSGTPAFGAGPGVDPFTGASRYVPGGGAPAAAASNSVESLGVSMDFPIQEHLVFAQGNRNAMSGKLRTFLEEQGGNEKDVEAVINLVNMSDTNSALDDQLFEQGMLALLAMLSWPPGKLLPVLDALRLVVRHKRVNRHLSEADPGPLLRLLHNYIVSAKTWPVDFEKTNRMLVLRTACNLFQHEPGVNLLLEQREKIANAAPLLLPAEKNTQIALATLLLNYCVEVSKMRDSEAKDEKVLHMLRCALDVLGKLEEGEAMYRLLVGLGTLLHGSDMVAVAGDVGLRDELTKLAAEKTAFPPKVAQCSEKILSMLL